MNSTQRGFSILSAIFLLVVLAFLGAAMVTFSTSQQQGLAQDVLGTRAYQAARAGVEWGAYQVLRNDACPASTTLAPGTLGGTLGAFEVTVTCASAAVAEVGAQSGTVTVYNIGANAHAGSAGEFGYVERQLQVTIAN